MLKKVSPLISRVIRQPRFIPTCNYAFDYNSKQGGKLYEPPYLDAMKPQFPTYDVINVKITGYDYPILESYQRFVHRIGEALNLDISECWAHPPKNEQIVRYKANSSAVVETEFKLMTYERYVQISDIQAPIYSLFVRFIQSGLPEGVTLSVVHHTEHLEESRYVPDKDLLELKSQLDDAGGPLTKTARR